MKKQNKQSQEQVQQTPSQEMEQLQEQTLPPFQPVMDESEQLDDGQTGAIPEIVPEMVESVASEAIEGIFTREEFRAGFYACFDIGGELTELKGLPIKESERLGADRTADKLYDIAIKYPALRWMINKNTAWMADMSLIGFFVYSKANTVLVEITGRSITSAIKGKLPWFKKEEKKAEYKAPLASQNV